MRIIDDQRIVALSRYTATPHTLKAVTCSDESDEAITGLQSVMLTSTLHKTVFSIIVAVHRVTKCGSSIWRNLIEHL